MRDIQRQRSYKWEDPFIQQLPGENWEQLQLLMSHLRTAFGLPDDYILSALMGPNYSKSYQVFNYIYLLPEHWNFGVLCHEFSHLVCWHYLERTGVTIQAHGPEWLTIYMVLLHKVCGFCPGQLIVSAESARLNFFLREVLHRTNGYGAYYSATVSKIVQNRQQREDPDLVGRG